MYNSSFNRLFNNKVLFKREFGTSIESFNCILDFIDCKPKPKQGNKPVISNVVKLLCFLTYLKKYESMESLGLRFGISTTTVWRIIHDLKLVLIGFDKLKLDGTTGSKVIMIDGTDTPVEKPKYDAVYF